MHNDTPPLSVEMSRAMLQAVDSAVALTDASSDHALVYVNPAFERLTGYTSEEVLGRNPRFLQNDDHDQAALEEIRRALRDAQPVTVTLRNYRKDGSLFFDEVHLSPLHDAAGRLTHYVGIQNDVTEQYLNQSKASRFEALVEAAPLGICMLDEQGVFVEVNDTLVELVGAPSSAAIVGKALHEFNIGQVGEIRALVETAMSGEQRAAVEVAWTSFWGKSVHARVHFAPVHDANGRFLAYQAIIDDIADRVAAGEKLEQRVQQRTAELDTTLQALRRSEERFHFAASGTNDGMWDWPDITQDAEWWSPRFYELLGYADGEIEASFSNFQAQVHPNDLASILAAAEAHIERDLPFDVEYRLKTKSGDDLWVRGRGQVIRNEQGEPVRMAGSIQDVSEQRAAAAALREAKEKAERATTTKSRFLAAASHDLRQPLQSIGMYHAILARQIEQPELQEITAKMRQSLDAMGELLTALLDISKLDSGAISAEACAFPVQNLFDQLSASNTLYAEEKGLRLEFEASEVVLHSDPALLQRIVENFVANAIRHTAVGHVRVACVVDGEQARIEVSDSGEGIPEHALETIFEEYVQLDNPERNRRKGLGLGLAIVKHIAALLGHDLHVSSTPGAGSTFSVSTPLASSQQPPDQPQHISNTLTIATGEINVLLVDDDSAIVDAAAILLELEGFTVHTAADCDAAIALLRRGVAVDTIVTDYRLPGQNGVALIQSVRALMNRELPAILMTGDTSVPEVEAMGLHACTLLHKPIDPETLISLIRTANRG